jgi:hypothetical protein
MAEERKGLWTPKQEKGIDGLLELKGIAEALDGAAIKVLDNQIIDRLLEKIPKEYLGIVYEINDEILLALGIEK